MCSPGPLNAAIPAVDVADSEAVVARYRPLEAKHSTVEALVSHRTWAPSQLMADRQSCHPPSLLVHRLPAGIVAELVISSVNAAFLLDDQVCRRC